MQCVFRELLKKPDWKQKSDTKPHNHQDTKKNCPKKKAIKNQPTKQKNPTKSPKQEPPKKIKKGLTFHSESKLT